jgi:hypothetical protein
MVLEIDKYNQLSVEFATELINLNFSKAHDYLSSNLKNEFSIKQLETSYKEMISDYGNPATEIELFEDEAYHQPDMLGCSYVSISGTFADMPDAFWNEGLSLDFIIENNQHKINEINLGRP